ncbi:MAG TPA: WhiB family transcriptional regulator [Mycobacteriales bacterium]
MTERTHPHPDHQPEAIGDDWEWQLRGACRHEDSELFFHPYGEREPSRGRRERAALAVCATCPVLLQCRTYALRAREPYGVWGGLTETDRQDILAGRRPPLERHSPIAV